MKRIVKAVCFTALLAATQGAFATVRDMHDWTPRITSSFPSDAEASYNLPALETYADRYQSNNDQQAGNSFSASVAAVVIDD